MMEYRQPTSTTGHILCCQCGVSIEPNSANMCLPCIQSTVDITEGIPRQIALQSCRGCERFFQPPAQWLPCALESKELMALFLRRIKGLSKVRLIDASFVWTEPHSKRIKVKVTIQREVFAATILQASFVIEAVLANQQCGDCARLQAKNTWKAVVQVRQKVDHKRTFLFLEQTILKHDAHRDTNNIKVVRDGIDFYFDQRNAAIKFVDFLQSMVPLRVRTSEQLITQDTHSGASSYKFTFSVEIVPMCRDDLLFLPPAIAKSLGNIPSLVLCDRVATSIHFVDPNSLQTAEMHSATYWKAPFEALCTHRDLAEFIVLDVESGGRISGKRLLADIQVAKAADFGRSSESFFARSHLGNILKPGDICLGYDLTTANLNDQDYEQGQATSKYDLPDVILVRKSYAHLRRNRKRNWRLKELAKDTEDTTLPSKAEQAAAEREYERFLEEIEEDTDMRANINIYRANAGALSDMEASEAEDVPRVSLDELLNDMTLEDG